MELTFSQQTIRCLTQRQLALPCQEQTAEIQIPETQPELGRIVDSSAMVFVQSKSLEPDGVCVTGAIRACVLYLPPEGGALQSAALSIPFRVAKKLPVPDKSQLFYWGWVSTLEPRFVNSRKLLLRAGLCSELTLYSPAELSIPCLTDPPRSLQCKTETLPLRLPLCAAERELQLADELLLGPDEPGIERLLKWSAEVELSDSSLIGSKAVCKGELRVRCLYETEDGELRVFHGSLPWSQYAELEREAEDGFVSVQPILRRVELETDGEPNSRRLLLNLTAELQIVLRAQVPVCLIRDAYDLSGTLEPVWQNLELQSLLDSAVSEPRLSAQLPPDCARVVDWTLFPAAPEEDGQAELGLNLLYYDAGRELRSDSRRWRLPVCEKAAAAPRGVVTEAPGGAVQGGSLLLPLRAALSWYSDESLQTLAGGSVSPGDGAGEWSLAVARAEGALWEIAKSWGSTVEALQLANELKTESLETAAQLLIPLGAAAQSAKEERE